MSNYIDKLKGLLLEHELPQFLDEPVDYSAITGESCCAEIAAAGPLNGLKYLGQDDGVLSFCTYQKASVKTFCDFLDNNDYVDLYDVSAVISDPFTKESNVKIPEEDFDFDSTQESQFIEYFVDVVIKQDLTTYNYSYVDNDELENDSTPFIYPLDSIDDVPSVTNDYGYDTLEVGETPLVIKLVNTKSASQFGTFSVTAHPEDPSKLIVQCNYSDVPEQDDVLLDLETLNSLNFGDKFRSEFKLIKPADYELGDFNTTSAVYKAINTEDVLNIVMEAFDSRDIKEVLTELTRVIKVNSRGKKRVKMQCAAGFKYDSNRKVCVKISGNELAISRIAHRQMSRTKKTLGSSYKTRIVRRMKRAKRFRKLMGL